MIHAKRLWFFCIDLIAGTDFPVLENLLDMVGRRTPLQDVIPCFALATLTYKMKQSAIDDFVKELVHAYGLPALILVENMKNHLFIRQTSTSYKAKLQFPTSHHQNQQQQQPSQQHHFDFALLRKSLSLFQTQSELSSQYSCYVPLSVRYIQWKLSKCFLDSSDGKHQLAKGDFEHVFKHLNNTNGSIPTNAKANCTLIVFVGGITWGEVSCIRKLLINLQKDQQQKQQHSFLIAATSIINRKSIIKQNMIYSVSAAMAIDRLQSNQRDEPPWIKP